MKSKPWYQLGENALLEKRISELGLTIQGTALQHLIKKLYEELTHKNLIFQPPYFLTNEWFCPYGIPAIGIPFYLADKKLRQLEQKHILEVEGGTRYEFMQLIRHESGHAYYYAYQLYKKSKWRKLFGSPSEEYPDTYRPRPYSRAHVIHLKNWYAQSHPEEDFAETFAVWLNPASSWKKSYAKWKALEKLEYVDQLMKQIAGKTPKNLPRFSSKKHSGLNLKLKTYYERKKKEYIEDFPTFYDEDLHRLFTKNSEERSGLKAAAYLKLSRPKILKAVSYWTEEKRFTIDQLLKDLKARCQDLGLYVRKDNKDLDLEIASYITSLITNYLFTGKFKRTK